MRGQPGNAPAAGAPKPPEASMTVTLSIQRNQIKRSIQDIDSLCREYKTPRARFETDRQGWIIEVEHLEASGKGKLSALLTDGNDVGEQIEFEIDCRSGYKKRKQYRIRNFANGTFAIHVNVRNAVARNFFRRIG
jgi:hypothetical protein